MMYQSLKLLFPNNGTISTFSPLAKIITQCLNACYIHQNVGAK